MEIGDAGLKLIKSFEGVSLVSYNDSVGVRTIGYGHTHGDFPDTITTDQADTYLLDDLEDVEEAVNTLSETTLTQGQFDALCSFVFNLGAGALKTSTLLKKLNVGDLAGAADEFLVWDHAGGKVLGGLLRRRTAERDMFLGTRNLHTL